METTSLRLASMSCFLAASASASPFSARVERAPQLGAGGPERAFEAGEFLRGGAQFALQLPRLGRTCGRGLLDGALEPRDVALERGQLVQRRAEPAGKVAVDGRGKLHAADLPRHGHDEARQLPPRGAELFQLRARHRRQLVAELGDFLQIFRQLFYLFVEFRLETVEFLVGRHDFRRSEHVAQAALAFADFAGDLENLPHHEGRARQGADGGFLPVLDPLGEFDFAFARQQAHRAHFAQIHAHRIVGFLGNLFVIGLGEVFFVRFFSVFAARRLQQVDAGFVQPRQQIVQVGARRHILGHQFGHVVIEDVALLLAHVDELLEPAVTSLRRHSDLAERPLDSASSLS
jgi:hypothetical protein